MTIDQVLLGTMDDGSEVTKYTLENDKGAYVSILNLGCMITEIWVPNQNGVLTNVVLGYYDFENNVKNPNYFGGVVGRFAGRISNASFALSDGNTYHITPNQGKNTLHGGKQSFINKIWSASSLVEKDAATLSLNYLSEDLEEGFPGNLDVTVTYRWNNDNELSMVIKGTTDKETVVNLANHTYFNLSGVPTHPIYDHLLEIDADQYMMLRDDFIPYDIGNVEGTPFDFRVAKPIGQDIKCDHPQVKTFMGYDHPFMLNKKKQPDISLTSPISGIRMEISTNQKCVVCYTGNMLPKSLVYGDIPVGQHSAVCLETQYYPDNVNFDKVPSETLKEGELYKHVTTYKFL